MEKIASIINCEPGIKPDVVLLGAAYDKTSSFGKGADRGPRSVRSCLDRQIELEHHGTGTIPVNELRIAWRDLPLTRPTGEGLRSTDPPDQLAPEEMVQAVRTAWEFAHSRHEFPIIVGGEHSVSNGAWLALNGLGNPRRLTIVQIDAHLDLRENDEDFNERPWGRFSHASVMRRAAELGFPILNLGARAYAEAEITFADAHRDQIVIAGRSGKFCRWDESHRDLHMTLNEFFLRRDPVYLTLDVDGLDPSQMPATGTPVQQGIGWKFLREFLDRLFTVRPVVGADIVEVAPRPNDQLTEYGAAQLCYDLIALHLRQRHHNLWPCRF